MSFDCFPYPKKRIVRRDNKIELQVSLDGELWRIIDTIYDKDSRFMKWVICNGCEMGGLEEKNGLPANWQRIIFLGKSAREDFSIHLIFCEQCVHDVPLDRYLNGVFMKE